jgi:hypothetical protein
MLQILLAVALLVAGALGTVSYSDGAAPGDLLYGLDRALENVRLQFAGGPDQVAQLQIEQARERLLELETVSAKGDTVQAAAVLDEFNTTFTSLVISASGEDDDLILQVDKAYESEDYQKNDSLRCENMELDFHPAGQALADRFEPEGGYDEIMGWFCNGFGFGEIQLAYSAAESLGITPAELFAMRLLGLGWGEILQANGTDIEPGDMEKAREREQEQDQEQEGRCTGVEPHPRGMDLAEDFVVTFETIMGYFCEDGYGFGEIKLAYQISLANDEEVVNVEEVFALRESGLGWGEIMQQYNLIGSTRDKTKEKPENPGKPEDAGPPEGVPANPGKPDNVGKPDKVGKPEKLPKPDK